MRARANVYHLECFACQQCGHRFCVGDHFYLHDNQVDIIFKNHLKSTNLMGTLAGAVWTRLRGEDGLCLPLLPPKPTCSTQTRVWRWWSAAAPAPLQPPEPERPLPPPARLLPYVLPSAATHPLATHIISAVLPAANLAMIESK